MLPNPRILWISADLVTFSEEIVNWKLHFFCCGETLPQHTHKQKHYDHLHA